MERLLARIAPHTPLPGLAQELCAAHAKEYARLQAQIREIEAKLRAWHKHNELSRRLAEVPGIGPIGATLAVMKGPKPKAFRCRRGFSARVRLTPQGHSTARKTRPGAITPPRRQAL